MIGMRRSGRDAVWLATAIIAGCGASPAPEPVQAAPFVLTAMATAEPAPAATASATAAPAPAPAVSAAETKRRWALDYVGKLSGDGLKLRVFWETPVSELKALRTQYDGECKSGDKDACLATAALAEQLGQTMDALEAQYTAMCKAGDLVACARLSLYWPCHHPDREVKLTHRIKCDGLSLVPELLKTEGKGAALTGARALGMKACDGGVAAGCVAAAASFEPRPSDPKRAVELHLRGCDLGSWMGCKRAFEVGREAQKKAPELGPRIEAAAKKQLDLALAACDGGDGTACAYAGGQRAAGAGVPRDVAAARALYKRACDAKVNYACDDLARVEREK
jgi:hypothetical protein